MQVSSAFIEEKGANEKNANLPVRQLVNVLEVRETDDGTLRANVTTVAAEEVRLTVALNEFNHACQRFDTVAEYELARTNYCEDIVEREQVRCGDKAAAATAANGAVATPAQQLSSCMDTRPSPLPSLDPQLVEDAITGNMLRMKDQTLHVSTATDVVDNTSVPPEWRVDDVRDLVALMLTPSPHRPNGMHSAQPTLVRAGPAQARRG